MTVLVVIEAVALALLALLVAGLLRSHAEILRTNAEILRALEAQRGAEPLVPAAVIEGATPDGTPITIDLLEGARPTLLAFLSSRCVTCHHFWNPAPSLALPEHARVVIVTMGVEAESESAIAAMAPPGIPVVMASDGWAAYAVPGAPYFAFVEAGTGRVVGHGSASDWTGVGKLITRAVGTDPVGSGPGVEMGSGGS